MKQQHDGLKFQPEWIVSKYHLTFKEFWGIPVTHPLLSRLPWWKPIPDNDPYEILVIPGNLALNEGITAVANLIIGAAETAFSNANSYLGVGDSSTAESAAQTGLQAATNKVYVAMDATYPQISSQTIIWQSTFDTATGNFTWAEVTVASGNSDSADNLNRKVIALGTKTAGNQWVLQLRVTLG